ncbi:TPA: hypothetical protein N0F65_010253 [Lagenidium giganteum]|uniref:3,4-dihydroxy-2-butanone-4-phosphate synthase n=1 Tax=Lagenidium giganteum TaxID=4803 RepID=A0AAV2YE20_9STRA|nr:TPA: hypothetical protein N0F65_010253 [Lagenidium giganteum]
MTVRTPEASSTTMSTSGAAGGSVATLNKGTSTIEEAIAAMKQGMFVVVMDNEDRENEGDLIMPAQFATEESLAFMIRHTTGIICVPALAERINALQLPLMVENNTEVHKCKFTVTVDLKEGNSTGVSAADRARTIRALADPTVQASAFNRPGHIFPLLAQDGGVLVRAGHTEAAVDLARLAGGEPVGYICEMNDDLGRMMRRPQLEVFAQKYDLPLITISDLIRYRVRTEKLVERRSSQQQRLKTPHGEFEVTEFRSLVDSAQTLQVLAFGDVHGASNVPVFFVEDGFTASVHAQWAQKQIVEQDGKGLLIYVNDSKKLLEISGEVMARQSIFGMGAQVVRYLGVQSIRLLTTEANLSFSPHGFGLEVVEVAQLQLS